MFGSVMMTKTGPGEVAMSGINSYGHTTIAQGALTVLSGKHYIINSLHVVTGASLLATSLVLTLRTHRARESCR